MMQEQEVLAVPYKGDKPYIFISYSRRDRSEVMNVIRLLQRHRYRVWYDEGIDPGTEWDDNIAMHIKQCGYFLAMISPNSVNSLNCKDEIKYARDLDKPKVLEAKGIEACCEEEDKILDWMKEEFDLNGIMNGIVGDSSELDEDLEVAVLKLESEDGTRSQDVRCEILDQIEYKNNQYLILVPVDENGEELLDFGEVLIALAKDPGNGEQKRYFEFEDEEVADRVFELFKNRKKGEFNFEDNTSDSILGDLSSPKIQFAKWSKAGLGILMYLIGFFVNIKILPGTTIVRSSSNLGWISSFIVLYLALSVLWFDDQNIPNILPLVKNKKIGWQMLGYVVWSLVIIAVFAIIEGSIFSI